MTGKKEMERHVHFQGFFFKYVLLMETAIELCTADKT